MKKLSLTKQLEEVLRRAEYWEQRTRDEKNANTEIREELKKIQLSNMSNLEIRFEREREKSELLFEIIRWHINPTTTNDPFCAEKIEKMRNSGKNIY